MFQSRLFILFGLVALNSCASSDSFPSSNPYQQEVFEGFQRDFLSGDRTHVFVFEEDREGQIDVCPCEFLPMGGVHKSSSYLKKAREAHNVIFLSAGNAVVPGDYFKAPSEKELKQLPSLVEYYNQNKLMVYGANSRDFLRGMKFFREQMSGAKFPILSSNIRDSKQALVFPELYDLRLSSEEKKVVRVISLSSLGGPELPDGLGKSDPAVAFQKLQSSIERSHLEMWIVLGDLDSEEVERIRAISERPILILGGRGLGQGIVVDDQKNSLWISGRGEGKTLNRVEVMLGRDGNFLDPFRWQKDSSLYQKLKHQFDLGLDKRNASDTLKYLIDRVPQKDKQYRLYRAEEIPLF